MLCAAQTWGHDWRGHEVLLHVDNEAIAICLNSGSIDHPPTQDVFRQFALLALGAGFTFRSIWISTSDNPIADALSRFQWLKLAQLRPHWDLPHQSGSRPTRTSTQRVPNCCGMGFAKAREQSTTVTSPCSASLPGSEGSPAQTAVSFQLMAPLSNSSLHLKPHLFSPPLFPSILPASALSIPNTAGPPIPSTPRSSNDSLLPLNVDTVQRPGKYAGPSLGRSSWISWHNSPTITMAECSPLLLHSPGPLSCVVGSLPSPIVLSLTLPSTSLKAVSHKSPTLPCFVISSRAKPMSDGVVPSSWLERLQEVQLAPSRVTKPIVTSIPNHPPSRLSSSPLLANPLRVLSPYEPWMIASNKPGMTPMSFRVTVLDGAPRSLQRRLATLPNKLNYLGGGSPMHGNCMLTSPSQCYVTYHHDYIGLCHAAPPPSRPLSTPPSGALTIRIPASVCAPTAPTTSTSIVAPAMAVAATPRREVRLPGPTNTAVSHPSHPIPTSSVRPTPSRSRVRSVARTRADDLATATLAGQWRSDSRDPASLPAETGWR